MALTTADPFSFQFQKLKKKYEKKECVDCGRQMVTIHRKKKPDKYLCTCGSRDYEDTPQEIYENMAETAYASYGAATWGTGDGTLRDLFNN